ncbi:MULTISPECIES: DUF4822 domain-containing protein [Sphingobacterium]|uniref:DUF4822 domain-containing protein n=1 Tax=Sphingobacterium populi TaxID=1812824 RepID=A0ABW5UD09_9SPHI|nr:DUF4822 domain-containing protein [Sphingobacterium sp. CFCC 11742]
MKYLSNSAVLIFLLVCGALVSSCSSDDVNLENILTPSQILASTPWETTGARDNQGRVVPLTDPRVDEYTGFAYFRLNGTFDLYFPDLTPKLQGDWTVPADGSTRTVVARDDAGTVLFTRVVDILTLTRQEFTYRIVPDEANPTVFYDIIHTPTDQEEPR